MEKFLGENDRCWCLTSWPHGAIGLFLLAPWGQLRQQRLAGEQVPSIKVWTNVESSRFLSAHLRRQTQRAATSETFCRNYPPPRPMLMLGNECEEVGTAAKWKAPSIIDQTIMTSHSFIKAKLSAASSWINLAIFDLHLPRLAVYPSQRAIPRSVMCAAWIPDGIVSSRRLIKEGLANSAVLLAKSARREEFGFLCGGWFWRRSIAFDEAVKDELHWTKNVAGALSSSVKERWRFIIKPFISGIAKNHKFAPGNGVKPINRRWPCGGNFALIWRGGPIARVPDARERRRGPCIEANG